MVIEQSQNIKLEDKINILIVDDHPENIFALEAILERLGQNIVKANSGEEALKYLLDQEFEIILLDVQMPGLDGFETAQLIRSREKTKNIPIIFLTAINRTDTHVSRGYSLGAIDYIFKPFDSEILLTKVKVFVDLAKKTHQLKNQLTAYKELEAFTYSISHDLSAPLRIINSFSNLLLNRYVDKLDKDGQEFLNIISTQSKQMKQLIDDLLNFSRITQKEIEKSNIIMTDLAQFVVDSIQKLNPEQPVNVKIGNLPEAMGDRSMIKQVMINLVENAFKYSKTKENPTIEIDYFTEDNEVVYYVSDNGIGFDIQYSGKIFDLFRRLHTSNEFEGTGIGLAIVRIIIQKHGGKIFAEGKVNEGAKFCFTLPSNNYQI